MFAYKSSIAVAAIAASLALGSAAVAQDFPSTVTVQPNSSAEEISRQLTDAGFSNVSDAKLSGSIYEAQAMWRGEEVHLRLDTENGELIRQASATGAPMTISAGRQMSDQEIKDQLETLGYSGFGEVNRSGDVVDVMASKGGERVNLRVEQDTGQVTEQPRDGGKTVTVNQTSSDSEITSELSSLGYSNFGEVTRSGSIFDVPASKGGEQVNVRIETETGAVTEQPAEAR